MTSRSLTEIVERTAELFEVEIDSIKQQERLQDVSRGTPRIANRLLRTST